MQKFAKPSAAQAALDWDDVRYFVELARHEKLTAAARILGVEHSTVSRRISALEEKIGIRLFDRLPKSWNLTYEGEQLLAYASRMEEEAHAFSRASLGVDALRGTVRISAPPVFASHFIVPRLAALHERWPAITIEIIGETRVANLYRREADLAVRLSRPEEPGLAARPLAEMGYGLYATARWIEKPREEWQFLGYEEALSEIIRDTAQQKWLEELSAGRPFALRSNDLAAIYQACRAGMGMAVLPHFLARNDPALLAVPGQTCDAKRPIWMVIHPDVRRAPRVRLIGDALTELFRQNGSVLL